MRVKELIFISFSFPACNFKNKCKAYCIQAKGQIYVCMYVCMYVTLYVHGVLWVVCIMNGFSLVCERVLSRIALLSMFYDNECIVDNFFWVKFQTSLNFEKYPNCVPK